MCPHLARRYDSVFLSNNSLPATKVAEWCVADPRRVRVVKVELVTDGQDHFAT